eukprot:4885913-Prymnesium_polylepis.1
MRVYPAGAVSRVLVCDLGVETKNHKNVKSDQLQYTGKPSADLLRKGQYTGTFSVGRSPLLPVQV